MTDCNLPLYPLVTLRPKIVVIFLGCPIYADLRIMPTTAWNVASRVGIAAMGTA